MKGGGTKEERKLEEHATQTDREEQKRKPKQRKKVERNDRDLNSTCKIAPKSIQNYIRGALGRRKGVPLSAQSALESDDGIQTTFFVDIFGFGLSFGTPAGLLCRPRTAQDGLGAVPK